jgi:hypothetical protein
MLDDFSKRTKAIRAALELAAERGWNAQSFVDTGQRAGLTLADLRREFACKSDILRAFQAEVDAETLSKTRAAAPEQSARDRLFDIIMTRFEVMAPYRPALRRILADLCCRPAEAAPLFCSSLVSQYWMLEGAGAKLDGPGAGLRVVGLAAIYGKTMRVWFDDASPGLDRTMATLDRRLRKGEDWLRRADRVSDFACGFLPRGWGRRRGESAAPPPPVAPASPSMGGG